MGKRRYTKYQLLHQCERLIEKQDLITYQKLITVEPLFIMATLYQKPVPVNMENPTTGRKKAKLAIRIWYTNIIAFSVQPFACLEELWQSKIS